MLECQQGRVSPCLSSKLWAWHCSYGWSIVIVINESSRDTRLDVTSARHITGSQNITPPTQHKTLINTCPHQMIFTSTFCLLQWNNIIGLDTTGGNCSLKSKQKSYKSICLVSVCFFLSAGSIQNPILIPILVMSSRGSHSWLESRHVKYLKEKESSADKEKPLFAIQFK